MNKKTIYRITINNWEKHNGTLKRGHSHILLSCNFLTDSKIQVLSPTSKLLFLSCLCVAGESKRSPIEVTHESLCFQSGVKSGSLRSQLDQLQSLQLLTYEKIETLLDKIRIDKIRKDKSIEATNVASSAELKIPPEILPSPPPQQTFLDETQQEGPPKGSKAAVRPKSAKPRSAFVPASLPELLANLPKETVLCWSELYPDENFMERELVKAFHYFAVQQKNKRPTTLSGWQRRVGSWLERSWNGRRR